jgi:hypothetical protein
MTCENDIASSMPGKLPTISDIICRPKPIMLFSACTNIESTFKSPPLTIFIIDISLHLCQADIRIDFHRVQICKTNNKLWCFAELLIERIGQIVRWIGAEQ